MIEERDANPTADTPARFRGRRAPTALTAGGTESSEAVARLSGTESSNPLPSSAESCANPTSSERGPAKLWSLFSRVIPCKSPYPIGASRETPDHADDLGYRILISIRPRVRAHAL
jgi:hypothetical protein